MRLARESVDKNDLLRDCKDLNDNLRLCNKYLTEIIENSANDNEIDVEFITKDLGKEIDAERETSNNRNEEFNHQRYMRTEDIHDWLNNLAKTTKRMKLETIGQTAEGRSIHIVKINSDEINLPKIFIDAGVHAREWISPAATLYLIEKLVKANAKGSRPISNYQWHIVPLANPDGYEYSHTHDRMWRKNRVSNPGSSCKGVDLNRNFAKGYGIGASNNPCTDVYKGTRPFSEKESIAIRDYIQSTRNIRAAVSIHSYGNYLFYPWGFKNTQHPRRRQLKRLAKSVQKSILKKTKESYKIGTAVQVGWIEGAISKTKIFELTDISKLFINILQFLGAAGGCTDDWYITQNIPYSFTFELPGKDKHGNFFFFQLPASNIRRVTIGFRN